MAAVNAPRFTPIVERPVRTVQAYRSRKAKAQREAVNAALRKDIQNRKGETQ
jgi:hypothetical protein